MSDPDDDPKRASRARSASFFASTKHKTSGSIEADDKPCPLTISDWIALLAAESQVVSGYKHLAVTVLLAAFSILMAGYAATRFETFGLSEWLIAVPAFCVIFVALIYYTKCTINIFKERDEDLEIVKEIISGELTDSNAIRRRWKNRETPANAEE